MTKEFEKQANTKSASTLAPCYKSRGITYGLFQRFPWDQGGVPFGSSSGNFKSADLGPGVGGEEGRASGYKPRSANKARLFRQVAGLSGDKHDPTPGSTAYFPLGRNTVGLQANGKFSRSRRVLPCEEILKKEDTNNVLFYKDKGRTTKVELKGNKFPEAGPDLKDIGNGLPGPGAYCLVGYNSTTFCPQPHSYSIPTHGIVKMRKNHDK